MGERNDDDGQVSLENGVAVMSKNRPAHLLAATAKVMAAYRQLQTQYGVSWEDWEESVAIRLITQALATIERVAGSGSTYSQQALAVYDQGASAGMSMPLLLTRIMPTLETLEEDIRAGDVPPALISPRDRRPKPLNIQGDRVFVIMEFGDRFIDSAYDGVIKPLLEEHGLRAFRVDELEDSGRITDQVLESIQLSRYVFADLSGERPNCYYETGFAHALGKELILTIREGEHIHFNLRDYRFIQWQTESDLRRGLRRRLQVLMKPPETVHQTKSGT